MSKFRFVASRASGQYGVYRGDSQIGYVTKVVHRVTERGRTTTKVSGWRASYWCASALRDVDGLHATRELAAQALASYLETYVQRTK